MTYLYAIKKHIPINLTLNISGACLVVTVSGNASLARRDSTSWRGLTCCTSTESRHTHRLYNIYHNA